MTTVPDWNPPRRRPGGVTTVAVVAAVFGGLGLLVSLWAMVVTLIGVQAQANFFQAKGGMSAEQQEVYQQMMADTQQVAQRWKVATLIAQTLAALTSAGLLIGGIGALQNRPGGRSLLVQFLLASIFTEAVGLAILVPMQMQTIQVSARWMPKLMESAAPPGKTMPKEAKAAMETVMTAAMYAGIVIAAAWALGKVVFFGFGARYLRRPHVLQFYGHGEAIDVAPFG